MKIYRFSLTAFLIAAAITLVGIYFWSSIEFKATSSVESESIGLPLADTAFGGLFSSLHIEDTLPYYIVKKAEDSFTKIKHVRDIKNAGSSMEGFSSGGIGIYSINKKLDSEFPYTGFDPNNPAFRSFVDSLNKLYTDPSSKEIHEQDALIQKKMNELLIYKRDSLKKALEKDKSYYFGLNGYYLKDYNTQFYIRNDNYNLAYVKHDTVIKNMSGTTRVGHYESKRIKVRYNTVRKMILIPVTKQTQMILKFVVGAFAIITAVLLLYFFLGLPIRFLTNISKGAAFTETNINILHQISIAALIIPVIIITGPYLLRLILWKMIPEDFAMESLLNRILENLTVLLMALITFFIAKAFKKGYKLQEDQDLTI